MWDLLRRKVVEPRHVHLVRITEKLNEGVPDITFCLPSGAAGWMELKAEDRYRKGMKIPWKSPAQPLFLYTWAQRGGAAGCLMRINSTDEWYWWRARGSVEWNRMIKTEEAFNNYDSYKKVFSVEWLVENLLGSFA
jgi:hypothetical protein